MYIYTHTHTCGSHQSHQLCERWLAKAPVTVVIGTINQFVKLELYTNLAIVNGGPIVYIYLYNQQHPTRYVWTDCCSRNWWPLFINYHGQDWNLVFKYDSKMHISFIFPQQWLPYSSKTHPERFGTASEFAVEVCHKINPGEFYWTYIALT